MLASFRNKSIAICIFLLITYFPILANELKTYQITHQKTDFRLEGTTASVFAASSTGLMLKTATPTASYISPTVESDFAFNAAGAHWLADAPEGTSLSISLRSSADGQNWGTWITIPHEEEPVAELTESGEPNPFAGDITGALAFFNPESRFIQYRVDFFANPKNIHSPILRRISLQIINSTNGPTIDQILISKQDRAGAELSKSYSALNKVVKPVLVKRDEWGAQAPRNNYLYTMVGHIAFHHTAGVSDYNVSSKDDCAARVRAIQSYHRNTLGWNDIGYAYAICKLGHIFQAREDDNDNNDVRGAHDAFNTGSQGVANLGYFHPPYNHQPTPEMLDALYRLLAWKCDERGINPQGRSLYSAYGSVVDHIYGHQEVRATACPGDGLFALKQSIKDSVEMIIKNVTTSISDTRSPVPDNFSVLQTYPNPFAPAKAAGHHATIQISLKQPAVISLAVHNILGQSVRLIYSGVASSGERIFTWDGTDDAGQPVPPGVYFYRFMTQQHVEIKKVLILLQ